MAALTSTPDRGGRLAAILLLAGGVVTLLNNVLPGAESLNLLPLTLIGTAALVLGVAAWLVPWERLPPRATLLAFPPALALVASASALGDGSAYSHSVFFVVVFVWVGLSQPPGTSYWLVPPAVVAYVWPLLVKTDPGKNAVASVTVTIPVCVLVGEVLARVTRRQQESAAQERARTASRERLVSAVAYINAGLDSSDTVSRVCEGARDLLGCAATGYATVSGEIAEVVAVQGPIEHLLGTRFEVARGMTSEVLRTRRPFVLDDPDRYPLLMDDVRAGVPDLRTVVAVPCVDGTRVVGALYASVGGERGPLSTEELDGLELLAAHIGAALRNASAHAEVVRQRAHEQAVVDGLPDGVAVLSGTGAVLSWNAAAAHLTGIPAGEVLGRPMPLPLPVAGTAPLNLRSGTGCPLEITTSPLPDGERVVTIRDVTRARELDEAKDLFIATASHELRTPLTVVKGFATTLQQHWPQMTDETRAESLAALVGRTDDLIHLVEALLLSVTVGISDHAMTMGPVDVGDLLHQAAAQVDLTSTRHVGEVVPVSHVLPAVWGDSSALAHVLDQLVENAVKFSPAGGVITLSAERTGDGVVIEVADRGVGLPAGAGADLFERFVQGHAGDRRPYGGVGLGLHIVRTLVEANGGTVSARERDGGGAVFRVTLRSVPGQRTAPVPARETGARRLPA